MTSWLGVQSLVCWVWVAKDFADLPGFFDILNEACLVPYVTLGADVTVFHSYWSLSLHPMTV